MVEETCLLSTMCVTHCVFFIYLYIYIFKTGMLGKLICHFSIKMLKIFCSRDSLSTCLKVMGGSL